MHLGTDIDAAVDGSGCCARPGHGRAAQGGELVFAVTEGVTYQATPKEIRDKFAPLADIMGKATGRRVRIVLVPSYNDVRAGLAKQEYDVAYVHPAHVSMAEIKAGRYKAIAWTTGFTEYTVSLMIPKDTPLKTMDDLKGRTLVTPDPDSITAVMVRAMFRGEKLTATAEREPPPALVRVITTRYQDAVPFYLENGFAHVGATAANSVVKAWTEKGGKVLFRSRAVPIKQIIVSTKMPADEQQKIREALLTLRDSKTGRDALDAVGYQRLRRAQSGSRELDHRLARAVADLRSRRPRVARARAQRLCCGARILHCTIASGTPMADLNRTIDRSIRISRSVADLLQRRVRAAGERYTSACARRRRRTSTGRAPKTPFEFARQWAEYTIDAAQRSVLYWDTLRQRGNQWLEHEAAGKPPVLNYKYEMIADARTLRASRQPRAGAHHSAARASRSTTPSARS